MIDKISYAPYIEPKRILYNVSEVLMITKYKRIIRYANMYWSAQYHRIKFKVLNQILFLKEKGHEHI